MKKNRKFIIVASAIPFALFLFGIKPTQAEFVCRDSTSRCNDTWGGNFWVPVNNKEIHLVIYGYELYDHPFYWAVFISERDLDLVMPKATRVSWFNGPLDLCDLIPNLAIQKIEDDLFDDRYELTFDVNRTHKIIMGERIQYFNPFKFRNGRFETGMW